MRLTRRGWNNIIIIGVMCFIAVMQLPELLRERFMASPTALTASPSTALLFPHHDDVQRIVFPLFTLEREGEQWRSSPPMAFSASTLAHRWLDLEGTRVDASTLAQLQAQPPLPQTIEVWLTAKAEPIRMTVYAFPQFWLLNNGQDQWMAVSVTADYLFPPSSSFHP